MVQVTTGSGVEQYAYGPDNKRIYKKKSNGTEEFYFYGIGGQKMGTYSAAPGSNGSFYLVVTDTNLYFGGKMILSRNRS